MVSLLLLVTLLSSSSNVSLSLSSTDDEDDSANSDRLGDSINDGNCAPNCAGDDDQPNRGTETLWWCWCSSWSEELSD